MCDLLEKTLSVGNRDVEPAELIYGNTVRIALFFSSLQEFLSLSVSLSVFPPPPPLNPTSPPFSRSLSLSSLGGCRGVVALRFDGKNPEEEEEDGGDMSGQTGV